MWIAQYGICYTGGLIANRFIGYRCDKCGFLVRTYSHTVKNSECPQCKKEREVQNERR